MKRGFIMILCTALLFGCVACGDTTTPSTSDSEATLSRTESTGSITDSVTESVSSTTQTEDETVDTVSNQVLACDQYNRRIVLYNLDLLSEGDTLEKGEIWSLDAGYAADMKYREDTVFGDVVLVAGTYDSGIYAYPEKTPLFITKDPGNNPHAVELLPSGNMVIANSTGNCLRLFYASAALENKEAPRYTEYELKDAHGLLWDPEYEVLWALGSDELAAYALTGEGTEEKLSKISSGLGASLPKEFPGGHDLSADLTNPNFLYLTTNIGPIRYDKENGTFTANFTQSNQIPKGYLKALSNNPSGMFFFVQTNGGKGTAWESMNISGWCSDQISCILNTENGVRKISYKSTTSAFYKSRAFCGQYQ